ncbi:MAG: MBOAT family protein [Clostridia bacterium]|nr:MBOAT family protein [Clostridia bacterium]
MLFSGIPFLYYFLPIVLILYFLAPKKLKNGVLLAFSLVFYAWGEPIYVILMVISILQGYLFGLLIGRDKEKRPRRAKLWMWCSVVFSLGMLGYFKYADFFLSNFNAVTGLSLPLLRVALPIGISFYTFQILSYVIDVYRGDVAAQKNPITLGAYIAMFPQLIAGPIVRYSDVERELRERKHTMADMAYGVRRFVLGLGKKVLIANSLGELCAAFGTATDPSTLFFWLNAVAYSLQIYFDFSGYSDMAIGLGRFFGFHFMENFNYPYISKSITEFWRRWHISLGVWFRDYLYIPLGGNRVSKPRWFFNLFVVWFATGFWHGAAWNFILWGLYFAVFLVIEKFWLLPWLQKKEGLDFLRHLYVLSLVLVSFVIFNAPDFASVGTQLGGLLGIGTGRDATEALYYAKSYAGILVTAVVGATPLPKKVVSWVEKTKVGSRILTVAESVFLGLLLLVVTAYLVDGSFNPFLYFRF